MNLTNITIFEPDNLYTEKNNLIFRLFLILFIILASFFNLSLLILFLKYEKVRNTSIIFIPVMGINDTIRVFWRLFLLIMEREINANLWFPPFCIIYFTLDITLYIISQYYLLFIFIYRYIIIKYPFHYENYLTIKRSIIIIILIIILTIIFVIFPVYLAIFGYKTSFCNGYFYYKFELYFIYLSIFLPVIFASLTLHVKILKIAKIHSNEIEKQTGKLSNISKSSKITILQLCIMIILWLYYSIVTYIFLQVKNSVSTRLVQSIGHIVVVQAFLNSLITIFGNSPIKSAFFQFFKCNRKNIVNVIN